MSGDPPHHNSKHAVGGCRPTISVGYHVTGTNHVPYRLVVRLDTSTLQMPLGAGELVLGSAVESDLRVPHFSISRRHAVLRLDGSALEIRDINSSNGTTVDGRRITGPTRVVPGQRIAFGGAEATFEEVSDADLEPAVSFPPGDDECELSVVEGDTPATSSLGALKRFTLDHLPELLRALAAGADAVEMVQRVGASLHATVPCQALQVSRGSPSGSAVLFEAGNFAHTGPTLDVSMLGGDATLQIEFAGASQLRGYAPLAEACARLVDLSRPSAPFNEHPVAPKHAPMPQPPTVEPRVQRLYADATRVARGDISVLIRGESGTGKEVLARYIHNASPRADAAYVAINCAALPRDLLEAELFGIEKGTATGVDERPGKLELADNGTLFLDEIGDMAADTQAKILRVLQENEVFRLGSARARPARVRVVSATNRDLDAMLQSGTFRSDLVHRIADWDVTIPTLRERTADIPNLAAFFLQREADRLGVRAAGISRAAMQSLVDAPWPGNVRQLEREMSRVVLFLENGQLVERNHLRPEIRHPTPGATRATLADLLRSVEHQAITDALAAADGDIPAAAASLGLGRSTLYRRVKELGIE